MEGTVVMEWNMDRLEGTVAAQVSVLSRLTGRVHDEAELACEAEASGWYQRGAGTPIAHMDRLLEAHGVPTETRFGCTVDDIAAALDAGSKVIVSVDGDELWGRRDDPLLYEAAAIPGQGAGQAVEVTGVAQTSEGPHVVLQDRGDPDGRGRMVPVPEFERAWADSDRFMVIAGPNADSRVDAFGTHGMFDPEPAT
jgi:hypothetical protein